MLPHRPRLSQPALSEPALPGPGYKWIALSNTTLGMLMATVNASILLIALPDIFRGIGVDPLQPANTSLLLWLIMGYIVVTAVLVVSFGRLGDMYGRVKMFNLGFALFSFFSVLLSLTWLHGTAAAWWLIVMRILQGVGGAMLMANSSAILTDAFPYDQRGLALGLNQVAGIAGSFIGLVLGGVLGPLGWRYVFLVSVPFGVLGTVWSYLKLREMGIRRPARLDWWGNLTFAAGLIALLAGITYGIQPYGGHTMGWTSPLVISAIGGGVALLTAFCVIETRVPEPMFRLSLFRIRPFMAGNVSSLLAGLGRGGLMFILIIWLQGIYLPRHGYSFSATPLWAGIAMLPLTVGFLIAGPVSGWLSDRFGGQAVRHRRHAGRRRVLLAPAAVAGQLRVLGIRPDPAAERDRDGPVRVAEPGRDHEQPAARAARRGRGDERDLPEFGHGAVDRHLLHADHPRPGRLAARRTAARPGRPGRAGRRRRAGGGAPAGLSAVRVAAGLQPGADAARAGAAPVAGGPRRLPDRPLVLPRADLAVVLPRPHGRVRLRRRHVRDRGAGLAAARRQVRAPRRCPGGRRVRPAGRPRVRPGG
jgi:MFS family permease